MIREYLWDGTFVTLRLCYREGHFPERVTLFDCDSHLAQTVQLLNEKGCCTTGCCEGHPCRTVSASGRRIRRDPVILAGGYLDFCRPEDRDAFLAALTPQGDQFYAAPSPCCAGSRTPERPGGRDLPDKQSPPRRNAAGGLMVSWILPVRTEKRSYRGSLPPTLLIT